MKPWYPASMTIGRSFDYQFLRKYGLTNAQEGEQIRSGDEALYTIVYAFESRSIDPASCRHGFGRLLVLKDCPPP
jgi:hypothetical protein